MAMEAPGVRGHVQEREHQETQKVPPQKGELELGQFGEPAPGATDRETDNSANPQVWIGTEEIPG